MIGKIMILWIESLLEMMENFFKLVLYVLFFNKSGKDNFFFLLLIYWGSLL